MALPNNILAQILEYLYADFLESGECFDINNNHCSLLHPCISISESTSFNPIYTFRLISSKWNKVFKSTAKLKRYSSHRIVEGPLNAYYYDLPGQSVAFRRYRLFRRQYGTSLVVFLVSSFFQLTLSRTMYPIRMWGI